MSGKPADRDPLEALVDKACREQALRSAPPGLTARVLAELERRAALPWWRRSFAHWPWSIRVGFVAASFSLSLWTNLAGLGARALAPVGGAVAALHSVAGLLVFMGNLVQHAGGALVGGISPWILYGGALGIGGLYAVLAGLCAATYRSLYVAR